MNHDQYTNNLSKVPPQALDVENALIGSLLLEGDKVEDIKTLLPEEAFYKSCNQVIYSAMKQINKDKGRIDMLTVIEKLRALGQLDEVGGATYISTLTKNIGSAAHLKYHTAIVYDKWVAREIIKIGSDMVAKSYDTDEILDVVQDARNAMDKRIMAYLGVNSTGISIQEAAEQSIEDYYKREESISKGIIAGVPASLELINKKTGGFLPQQLIVLAGRPGMGKTSFAISLMLSAAKHKKSCAFFSLEMTSVRLTDKVICSISNVSFSDYKNGKLLDNQKQELEAAKDEINKMDVTFNDDMIANIEQIHAMCKAIKGRKGLDIIFIDYLQLMKTAEKTGNRENEISTMSRKAKMMAVDLNVPVIMMSQLNRGLESRTDKRPMLSDLRESGAIEQDADIVMFIYRDCVYNEGTPKDRGEIIIAKHREGETGIVEFINNESLTRFHDAATVSETPIDPDNKDLNNYHEDNPF